MAERDKDTAPGERNDPAQDRAAGTPDGANPGKAAEPAAAPLGTDAEAGGVPPATPEAKMARRSEPDADAPASNPSGQAGNGGSVPRPVLILALAVAAVALIGALIVFAGPG